MNRLGELIEGVWKEKEEDRLWDVWLFKDHESRSFDDFLRKATGGRFGKREGSERVKVTDAEKKQIIKDSQSMLAMFSM